jgi:cobalamin biosynthesis protein CobW
MTMTTGASRIPVTIVTGLLGSGKTTLIRHLLGHSHGRRLALIINEFGEIGVDRELLSGHGDACADEDMIELANGCICCTVAEDFIPAITALLARPTPPDHIVIETSGLALPQPLVRAFNWPEIADRLTVDGVVMVADAQALAAGRVADNEAAVEAQRRADPLLDHLTPIGELFADQLIAADLVVLSKADAVPEAALAGVEAGLRSRLRPGTGLVRASFGALDPALLLGLDAHSQADIAARPSAHEAEHGGEGHEHDDFDSFVVTLPATGKEALLSAIRATITSFDVLRLKGFAAIDGIDARLTVQAVGPRLSAAFERNWRPGEDRRTSLVVIGESPLDREAIGRSLGAAAA